MDYKQMYVGFVRENNSGGVSRGGGGVRPECGVRLEQRKVT